MEFGHEQRHGQRYDTFLRRRICFLDGVHCIVTLFLFDRTSSTIHTTTDIFLNFNGIDSGKPETGREGGGGDEGDG